MAKRGMKKADWRESLPRPAVPKAYKPGERERELEILIKATAPAQKEFRSKAAEEGERIAPTWKPDDIGTDNFSNSTGTAYLRKM